MSDSSFKSQAELQRVFFQRVPQDGYDDSTWLNEREHALGEYWRQRLTNKTALLPTEDVEQLLFFAELESALGVIGDAARMNMLRADDCAAVIANHEIDQYPKAAWAKTEVRLRNIANRLLAERDAAARKELLAELLNQTRYWPLESVLDELTDDELVYCEEHLVDSSVLTKSAREQARQAIRRIRKKSR